MSHLSLRNYRNYRSAELSLRPGFNLLVGKNGQGKTNLAEAIMYLANLRSHRVTGESALIRAGCPEAVIRMKLQHGTREALLELQINRSGPNKAQLNRGSVRPREITRVLSAILFAPEDLTIARGEPAVRRRFLDDALISRYPAAAGVLSDYDRVLKQRNTLLKTARVGGSLDGSLETLAVWDEQLIDLGSQIIEHRRAIVADLVEPAREAYFTLVGEDHRPALSLQETLSGQPGEQNVSRETSTTAPEAMRNVSRETIREQFHRSLSQARQREVERGQTLVGPHRDDLLLELNDLPVKGYASHGEHWSFVLALRLALASVLKNESTLGDPLLILDDVFAELDDSRRERLLAAVGDYEQVIVTAAVRADVPLDSQWHTVEIEAGAIVGQQEAEEESGSFLDMGDGGGLRRE